MRDTHFHVELLLVETGGVFKDVGGPRLVCRFAAASGPGGVRSARIDVLAWDAPTGAWREHARALEVVHVTELVARIEALGAAGRRLDVQGVVDTADVWTSLHLSLMTSAGASTYVFSMQGSGFEGADAEELRALLREVFALAGFRHAAAWADG